MKRLPALLLLVAFCLSAVSCAAKDSGEPEQKPAEEDVNELEGYEIRIGQTDTSDSYVFAYAKGTPLADALLAHLEKTETDNGCTLAVTDTPYDKLTADAAVGNTSCELIFSYDSGTFTKLAKADALADLGDYRDVLDYETNNAKWGSVYLRELGMYKGGQYGLVPYYWPEMSAGVAGALAVNEQLVLNYGKEDPRELIEQKKWGWQDFEAYLRDCTFEDGVQYYGFSTGFFYDLVMTAFVSNGCEVFRVAEDGTYTSDVNSEQGLEALQWASDLSVDYIDCIYDKKLMPGAAAAREAFLNNNVFILMTSTSDYTSSLAYEMKDIGFVPFAVGPRGEYGKWGGFSYDAYQLSINATADDRDVMAKAVGIICEPLEAYSSSDALLNYYTENVFFDKRDAEFYLELSNSARYTIFYGAVDFVPFWNGFVGTSQTAVEVVDSTFSTFLPIAEEYILPNAIYMNSLTK